MPPIDKSRGSLAPGAGAAGAFVANFEPKRRHAAAALDGRRWPP
jgi:hypothetical protein